MFEEYNGKAFPFKMSYKHTFFYINVEENKSIWQWMVATLKGEWEYWEVNGGGSVGCRVPGVFDSIMQPMIIVAIDTDEDAALFKLTWV